MQNFVTKKANFIKKVSFKAKKVFLKQKISIFNKGLFPGSQDIVLNQ